MSGRLRTALLIVAGVGLALASTVAGAAKVPWSGNAAAVAFYRTAVAKTNAVPAIQDVQLGYYWLWDDAYVSGSTGPFELNWGYATKPSANMVRAQATFLISMVGGKQSWYTVTFTGGPAIDPLELYVTTGGDYWGYQTKGSSQVGCWSRATGTTAWIAKDFTVGAQWRTYGKFSPLVTRGNSVFATSTYTNVDGAKVTETDSIDATSKLFTGSVIHVSRSTRPVYAAHSYTLTETDPTTPPVAPSVTLCG